MGNKNFHILTPFLLWLLAVGGIGLGFRFLELQSVRHQGKLHDTHFEHLLNLCCLVRIMDSLGF